MDAALTSTALTTYVVLPARTVLDPPPTALLLPDLAAPVVKPPTATNLEPTQAWSFLNFNPLACRLHLGLDGFRCGECPTRSTPTLFLIETTASV